MHPDDARLLITIFSPVLIIMLGIIGFFLKKIDKRLDTFMTKEECAFRVTNCLEKRDLRRESDSRERLSLLEKVDSLVDGFDGLCKCLTKYTKGECP